MPPFPSHRSFLLSEINKTIADHCNDSRGLESILRAVQNCDQPAVNGSGNNIPEITVTTTANKLLLRIGTKSYSRSNRPFSTSSISSEPLQQTSDDAGRNCSVSHPSQDFRIPHHRQAAGSVTCDSSSVTISFSRNGRAIKVDWHRKPQATPARHSDNVGQIRQRANARASRRPTPLRNRSSAHQTPSVRGSPISPSMAVTLPPQLPNNLSQTTGAQDLPAITNDDSLQPIPPRRPFNHFPPNLRRGRELQRENAFYHKSHYEIFHVPEFGDYNKPLMTFEEAMPPWMQSSAPAGVSSEHRTHSRAEPSHQCLLRSSEGKRTHIDETVANVSPVSAANHDISLVSPSEDIQDQQPHSSIPAKRCHDHKYDEEEQNHTYRRARFSI